jgi:hypothetical protein
MQNETIVIEGEANVKNARLLTLRRMLKLEIDCPGLRHSRGSVRNAVMADLGLSGNPTKKTVLLELENHIERIMPGVMRK